MSRVVAHCLTYDEDPIEQRLRPRRSSLQEVSILPFLFVISHSRVLRSKRCLTQSINRRSPNRSNIGRSTSYPVKERSSALNTSWTNRRRTSVSCRHWMKTSADRRGRRFKKSSVSGIGPSPTILFHARDADTRSLQEPIRSTSSSAYLAIYDDT